MKHFANFVGSPSQADDNSFLNRLKVPLSGLGGQAAGVVRALAGAGVGLLGGLALSRRLSR